MFNVKIYNYTGVNIKVQKLDSLVSTFSDTQLIEIGQSIYLEDVGKIKIFNDYEDVVETSINKSGDVYIAAQRNDGTPIFLNTKIPKALAPIKSYQGLVITMNISFYDYDTNKHILKVLDRRFCPFGLCRIDDEVWIFFIFILLIFLVIIIALISIYTLSVEKF